MTKLILFLLSLFAFNLTAFNAYADIIGTGWIPPTARTNGVALLPEEIAGYNVYLDGIKHNTTLIPDTTYTLTLDKPAMLTVTAIDTDGRESVFSSPPTPVNGLANPNAPSGITFTITIDISR